MLAFQRRTAIIASVCVGAVFSRIADQSQVAVGHRIRELRGFYTTQEEFAHRIGVSQGHLSLMEHGKVEIGPEILLAISQEFRKPLEWLLIGDKDGKSM